MTSLNQLHYQTNWSIVEGKRKKERGRAILEWLSKPETSQQVGRSLSGLFSEPRM